LGENSEEKDAEEIIDMANKASVTDQQKQVQENVNYQLKHICKTMDNILRPDTKKDPSQSPSDAHNNSRRSGLSFAVGTGVASANKPGNMFLLSPLHWSIRSSGPISSKLSMC
jgi:hypothetical protein